MKSRYFLYIFIVVLFSEIGCAPKMVVYDGTRMPSERAIDIIKQKAQEQMEVKNYEGAMRLYSSIANIDNKSDQAPAGILKAGNIALGIKSYRQASSYYNEVAIDYPGTDYATDAKMGLGIINMRESGYASAIDVFKSIIPDTSDNKRGRVYFLLGESYYKAGMYKDSFDALAHSLELLSTDQEKELSKLLLQKVTNEKLTDTDIQQLLNNHYNIYEESILRLKLAQDLFVSNDYKGALALVNAIMTSGIASPDIMNKAVSLKNEILSITQVNMNDIGCVLPLTGDFTSYGKQVLNGIELALGVFSTTTSPYKLFIKDSKGIPELAVKQAEELVKDDHVAAIIGPLLSSTAMEVAYKMQTYNVPMIYLNQKSSITKMGDYVFQNSLTPEDQTREIVNYAMEKLGMKNFAVLYPENSYGEGMMRAFVKQVLEHGGAVTGMEGYYPSETDFKVQIKKLVGTYYLDLRKSDIRKLPPDQKGNPPPIIDFSAIYIPDYYEKVAMIAPQLLYYDINNVQLLGGNGWSGQRLIQMGGRYVDGGIYTDGFFTQSTNPVTQAFVGSYDSLFNQEPTILSALGYDSANILITAMKNATNRQDIKNNILRIKDFNGVTGTISYNDNMVPVKKLYLLKVHGKKIVEITYRGN
jgi:ABC-type branched-subunit amino acid transport system substrate-binding protein/outer membrane protein assembly factor BamD (BamD/ComL family)